MDVNIQQLYYYNVYRLLLLIPKIVITSNQISTRYFLWKLFLTNKTGNVLKSSKNEEITFPHEFIFVIILFPWGGIVKKMLWDRKKR